MKEITEIVRELQELFSCQLVGEIQAFGETKSNGEVASDIDFFARPQNLTLVTEYLQIENFILEKRAGVGLYARKCIGGKIYHIDIAIMPLMLHYFPDVKPKQKFYIDIWENRNIEKFFRYVIQLRGQERYTNFVKQNFEEYGAYLTNEIYFNQSVFRKNVSLNTVVAVMQKKWRYYPRAFTGTRLMKLGKAFLAIQCKKMFSGKGEVIAFVGADGAGKTTSMLKMAASIGTHHIYMGDSQFKLQSFYEKLFTLPKPMPYIAYPIMYVEQWMRCVWIWYKKLKGDIVLTDRWPGYNQNFFKSTKNRRLFRVLYTFFPQPDRFIFLHAPAETIIARKNELTVEQINIMHDSMRKALRNKEHIEVVTDDFTRSMNEILRYLMYGKEQVVDIHKVLASHQPTIIDFTGIYASGKTSTAKALAQALRERGYKVLENDDMWAYLAGVPKFKRWVRLLVQPAFWRFLVDVLVSKFFTKKADVQIVEINNRQIKHHITGPIRDVVDRQLFIRNNQHIDFIVFDEGSPYVAMDLLWKYNIPVEKIAYYASKISYKTITHFFYFRCNPELSIIRTGERKSTSLIDNESQEVRKRAIEELLPYHEAMIMYCKNQLGADACNPEDGVDTRVNFILKKINVV